MWDLPIDLWTLIVGCDVYASLRARVLSKWHRDLVDENEFVDIKPLDGTCVQKELCARLSLKPDEARRLPYTSVAFGRYGEMHIFDLAVCVPLAFDLIGVDTILKRQHAKAIRLEKSASLPSRRRKGLESRTDKLDCWWSSDLHWSSRFEWKEWMSRHGLDIPAPVAGYLRESVSAPSFSSVVATLNRMSTRTANLVQELALYELQLRSDSRLCKAYILGLGLPTEFNTPSKIAHQMAFMHWLHTCTDYEHQVEVEVEALCEDNDGRYYSGIYRDAQDGVKCRFTPPDQWPWMASHNIIE